MANETKLNMTLLLRRADFDDSCVLKEGEPGYHTVDKVFKVGDGTTPWGTLPIANASQIQAMIDATASEDFKNYYTKTEVDNIKTALEGAINGLDGELAAEVTARTQADAALQTAVDSKLATTTYEAHLVGHAKTATEITAEIGAAVNTEKEAREAADKTITDTLGDGFDTSDNTVAKKIAAAEAAAKSHAETKSSDAQSAAIAEAEAKDVAIATAAAEALSSAKTELEGKITSGDATTLADAKKHAEDKVAAEAELRIAADNALDGRLDTVEAKLNNVSNVMDFVGAADALPAEGANQSGDVIVITTGDNAGKEFVYDDSRETGKKWVEFGSTSATDSAVAALKERMDAAEGDIDQAQADILALGTAKLDADDFDTWKQGHEADNAAKQTAITSAIATAKSEAITKAGELDTALHTEISKEIDDDVKAAIDAEVLRANGAYDAKGAAATAETNAKSYADTQDTALATALKGTKADGDTTAETIRGAKDYADKVAAAAQSAAESTASADATAKANAAQSAAEATAAADATSKANTAKAEAIAAVVGTANDAAETDTIKGVRKAFAAADTATLTSAQAYTDAQLKAAAAKVKAGTENDDIIVTPNTSTGETTVAHKTYATGTYTKVPESSDKTGDIYFFDSIATANGHVTGGTMKSLASILEGMTFIFDGGTSKTTVE